MVREQREASLASLVDQAEEMVGTSIQPDGGAEPRGEPKGGQVGHPDGELEGERSARGGKPEMEEQEQEQAEEQEQEQA